jgi:hypothetical protein
MVATPRGIYLDRLARSQWRRMARRTRGVVAALVHQGNGALLAAHASNSGG